MTIEPEPSPRSVASVPPVAAPAHGQCARHPDRSATLTCTRCGDNLCESCAEERIDGVCKSCLDLLSNRGKVWQVQWLAVVTIVHGSLLLLWSFGLLLTGGFMGLSLGSVEPTQPDAPPPEFMAGFMTGIVMFMMLGQLVPGILQVASGYYMLSFRYRWLAVAAFCSGALSVTGCYCLPTSIILAIWGLIVVFDKDVAARFQAGS